MLCYHCMREKGDAQTCPYCHETRLPDSAPHHLVPGSVVGRRYVIGRALGEGGFGITYIGLDNILRISVAVKEYFPHGYSHRDPANSRVVPSSSESAITFFQKGKDRFLLEAQSMARFSREPGIVDVRDFFEENNTAYIVMEYLEGVDLRHYLRKNGVMSPDKAFSMLTPAMRTLEKIHKEGLIHRDISPDNIMYLNDGSLKLMDFGSARIYSGDNRSMSVMLKQGYAPIEQYQRKGDQGPWTDVYGMCATLYRCITGQAPPDSADRVIDDTIKRPSELGVPISPAMENVLMYGLAVRKEDRCPNMTELLRLISAADASAPMPRASGYQSTYYVPQSAPSVPVHEPSAAPIDDPDRTMKAEDVTVGSRDLPFMPLEHRAQNSGVGLIPAVKPVPQSGAAPNGREKPKSAQNAKGCGTILGVVGVVLVLGLICALVGWIVTSVLPKSTYESFFLKTVDYVDQKIDLSAYNSSAMDDKTYIGNDGVCSATWSEKAPAEFPTLTTPLELEGGVSYVAGRTTVGDFLDKGYILSESAPSAVPANESSKSFSIYYQDKRIYISAKNDSSLEKPIAACIVDYLSVGKENGVSFAHRGLNGDSSFDDMLTVLGKPNDSRAVSIICMNTGKSTIYFTYHYSNGVTIEIQFRYQKKAEDATFDNLIVY